MDGFSKKLALLLLGLWLGGAIFFAAVVAPALFDHNVAEGLSPAMRGAISGAILRQIYRLTYVVLGSALFFLLIAWMAESKGGKGARRAFFLCALALGLNAASHLWVLDRINKVKVRRENPGAAQAADIEREFQRWHRISKGVYAAAAACGALAAIFLLPAAAGAGKPRKAAK